MISVEIKFAIISIIVAIIVINKDKKIIKKWFKFDNIMLFIIGVFLVLCYQIISYFIFCT